MDALNILKADHDKVDELFKQLEGEQSRSQKLALFNRIRDELLTHAHVEETVFYPAFSRYPEFEEPLADAYRDHEAMKALLEEIRSLKDDLRLNAKLTELIQSVRGHAQDEESRFFALVRRTLRRSEREQLGRHLMSARQQQAAA
jgi:hemerythrin superfamily protein